MYATNISAITDSTLPTDLNYIQICRIQDIQNVKQKDKDKRSVLKISIIKNISQSY